MTPIGNRRAEVPSNIGPLGGNKHEESGRVGIGGGGQGRGSLGEHNTWGGM